MLIDLTMKVTPQILDAAGKNDKKAFLGHIGTHFDAMKLELIQWLSQLDDKGVLGSLFQFKRSSEKSSDWADTIPPGERRSIERGLKDVREGRLTSSKDFWARHGQ